MQGKFIFLNNTDTKVLLYFVKPDGEVIEISWGNEDYIKNKLDQFEVNSIEDLNEKLADKFLPVYEYSYKGKDGNKHSGYTLDEPFPEASDPTNTPIVQGKVADVKDNGVKVAIIVQISKDKTFTVVRGYSAYDKAHKKFYPLAAKKKKILNDFGVDNLQDLLGKKVQMIRQKAGSNFYYEA